MKTKAAPKSKGTQARTAATITSSSALRNERPEGLKMIEEARLVRFPNRTKHRRYTIEFSCPEFTCICPMSGFPDFAVLNIKYVPRDWCVELKSLKLYINKYRNEGVFHEDVVNVVMDDLVALLDPWELEIVGDFNVRGNIKTIIRAVHQRSSTKNSSKKESKEK